MTTTREARFMNLSPPHFGRAGLPSFRPKYSPVIHPPLLREFAGVVDAKLGGFPNRHLIPDDFFGRPQDWYERAPHINTAEPIAMTHQLGAGFVGSQLASSIYIHPEQPQVLTALSWGYSQLDTCDQNSSNAFLVQHVFLRFANYSVMEPRFLQKFHRKLRPTLLDIGKKYPCVATAMFFCPAAHELLRKMKGVADMKEFPWTFNSTTVHPSPPPKAPRPPDNPHPLWNLPELDPAPRQNDHIRRSSGIDSAVEYHYSPGRVTAAGKRNWQDNPAAYIQRAWANAVRNDASVIVFDCGNYLRIGIRHRETQTLTLSDLLDVGHAKNPAYGKIWAGMHIGIAQDLMERYRISLESQPVATSPSRTKRACSDTKRGPNKKRRITVQEPSARTMPQGTTNQMNNLEAAFSRHLAIAIAICIQVGLYNSPSPSILLQPGQRRRTAYPSTSYLTLVLNSRLGTGATGDVFTATVPNVKHGPIVVKLATTFRRLCRLRHEYSIYCHLKAANVRCIPRVFGFYQDGQCGAGVLILSNNGHPLGGRRKKLAPNEKALIRAAVSSIHAAGVLHRDLRTWNILLNDAGDISIIDFDRSNTTADECDFQVERERLEKLLKGQHVENGEIIGKDGMPANIGDLVNDNLNA